MKVICIEDISEFCDQWGFRVKDTCKNFPKVNEIYTMVNSCKCECGCGSETVALAEFPHTRWDAKSFRPVDEQSYGDKVCERIERELTLEPLSYYGRDY